MTCLVPPAPFSLLVAASACMVVAIGLRIIRKRSAAEQSRRQSLIRRRSTRAEIDRAAREAIDTLAQYKPMCGPLKPSPGFDNRSAAAQQSVKGRSLPFNPRSRESHHL